MSGVKRLAATFALVALVAAMSGCGSEDVSGTIPPAEADQLIGDLDAVETATASQDCATAEARAQDFVDHVNELPITSGETLKAALREAGDNLQQLVQQPCVAGATGETGEQPTNPREPTSEETTTTTTTSSTTTSSTPSDETPPPEPPATGNENGGGGGGGQSGGGGPSGGGGAVGGGTGGTGGSGGTGVGGSD